ncbi:MAG: hypothetical protein ABJJ37_27065 [Roseibium sp.]
MTHIRQQVRDAVVTNLTGLPSTGARCFPMRTYPRNDNHETALLIYTLRETSETSAMGGADRDLMRQITLIVEIQARGADFDDKLDQAAVDVEKAMFTNRKLGGLAIDTALRETYLELATDRDERRGGVLVLSYLVTVEGPEGNPETVS